MIIVLASCKMSKSSALCCTTNSLSGPLIVWGWGGGLAALNVADLEGGELQKYTRGYLILLKTRIYYIKLSEPYFSSTSVTFESKEWSSQ